MSFINPAEVCKPVRLGLRKAFAVLVIVMAGMFTLTARAALPNPPPAPAGESLELVWDPVPEAGIAGYRVYVGTESGHYTRILETATDPAQTVDGLVRGLTYYFAVSAFNIQGQEGELSIELAVTIATPPLPMESVIRNEVSTGGGLTLSWSFPQSALGSSPEFIVQESVDLIHWSEAAVVGSGDSTGESGDTATFDWPVPAGEGNRFYRLTARNWLGESGLP